MTNSTDVTHARGKPCAAPRPLHAIDRFQETMKAHPDEAREIVATLFDKVIFTPVTRPQGPATSLSASPRSAACSRSIAMPKETSPEGVANLGESPIFRPG